MERYIIFFIKKAQVVHTFLGQLINKSGRFPKKSWASV